MPRPDKVETLGDVKTWIADHNGRIDAYWRAQHSWNDVMEARMDRVNERIIWLERRIMFASGMAAALGGLLGSLVQRLF